MVWVAWLVFCVLLVAGGFWMRKIEPAEFKTYTEIKYFNGLGWLSILLAAAVAVIVFLVLV